MKGVPKFSCFFILLSTSMLSIFFAMKFFANVIDFFKAETDLEKATVAALMQNNLVFLLCIFSVGIALVSIISLLIQIKDNSVDTTKKSDSN